MKREGLVENLSLLSSVKRNTKQRNPNIELLRICCMLMVICEHIIMCHYTPQKYSLTDSDEIIRLSIWGACSVAVNTFVLISGYFGIQFKLERIMRLEMQTIFYSISLLFFSLYIGWYTFTMKSAIFALFPVFSKQHWFVTNYVILYLISPFLNKLSLFLKKSTYKHCLIFGLVIIYVWPTLSYLFNSPQFIGDCGYGIVNFSYLYMLGRYIYFHYEDRYSFRHYFSGYLLVIFVLFLCQLLLSMVLGFEFTSWISYNTIFMLIGAVCLFLAFRRVKIQSKMVNSLSKHCFAVYLIHASPFVWMSFCSAIRVSDYKGIYYICLLVILPVLIYLFCIMIEYIRIGLMGKFERKVISIVIRFVNYRLIPYMEKL